MEKLELNIQGSEEYLNVVGGFIRHAFFFKKKAFKCIGMHAKYADTNETVQVSTIFGTELPQVLLLKLNTLNLVKLEDYLNSNECVRSFNDVFSSNGINFCVNDVCDDMIEVSVDGDFRLLKSTDLSSLIGSCDEFNLYSSVESRKIILKLFFRYDFGYHTEEENLKFISKGDTSQYVSIGTLHKYDCNFGYTVEKGTTPKLILNVDNRIDLNKLSDTVSLAINDITNSL